MPAKKINQPVNTFVKGLITEASPLTFPENASLDEVNFRLLRDGSRDRRLGQYPINKTSLPYTRLEFEKMYAKAYKWEQPKGASREIIGVIQIGTLIYFVDLYSATQPALLNGGNAVDASAEISGNTPVEFATLQGYLLLVNEEQVNPYIAWYDDVNDIVNWGTAEILVRDMWGVDDTLLDDYRPTSLSDKHKYNLRNQGWNSDIITTCGTDILDCFFSSFGKYPSNSDSWGAGRTADLTSADVYKFDPELAKRNSTAISTAAKGHYIMSAFFRGRDRHNLTGVTTDTDIDESFFSTIEAYAGRAWFSGVRGKVISGDIKSPNYNNAVFFSQVMETPYNLVRCYQQADPTSYEFNEVIDTDGGIIFIPECSFITKIKHIKSSMWVFGDNGVWEIRGPEGTGFTATSFEVRRINAIGLSSKDSVVIANGTIFYWSYSGIYAILPNPNVDGVYDTINVTQSTIQTRYDDFDTFTKTSAKGIYDPYNNKIRWLLNDSALDTNYFSLAECNHHPVWLKLSSTKAILITRKNNSTDDYSITYAYVIDFTNNLVTPITNPVTLASSDSVSDLYAHTIILGYTSSSDYELYYFYQTEPSNNLIVQKLLCNKTSFNITRTGNPVTMNSLCNNQYVHIVAALFTASLSFTYMVVAFHDSSTSKVGIQYVDHTLTYGAITSSNNTTLVTQPISIVTLSSTTGVVCYRSASGSSMYLEYFTRSGTSLTINSSTAFYNVTQVPSGTHTVNDVQMVKISSTKLLVCARVTNATLGYTNVISCFIVTISGSVLTSTTLLDIPTEVGTNPIPVILSSSAATIIYENGTSYTNNKLRYINIDISGTTPVLGTVGDWYADVGTTWDSSHVHAELALDSNTIATAFRGLGSLGFGSEGIYVSDVP